MLRLIGGTDGVERVGLLGRARRGGWAGRSRRRALHARRGNTPGRDRSCRCLPPPTPGSQEHDEQPASRPAGNPIASPPQGRAASTRPVRSQTAISWLSRCVSTPMTNATWSGIMKTASIHSGCGLGASLALETARQDCDASHPTGGQAVAPWRTRDPTLSPALPIGRSARSLDHTRKRPSRESVF